jgi:hypothetical protein
MQNEIMYPDAYAAATKRRIIQNASITFFRTVEDAQTLVAFMHEAVDMRNDEFMRSLALAYENYGKLTEKQCQAIRNSMARRVEWKAKAAEKKIETDSKLEYLGEVGAKKFPLTITVKKIKEIQGMSFSYYDSGVSTMYICEDINGNKVTYFGNSEMPKEGETAEIVCTIKAHKDYQGTKQTVITRPKIVKMKE